MPVPNNGPRHALGSIVFYLLEDMEHRLPVDVIVCNEADIRQHRATLDVYDHLSIKPNARWKAGLLEGISAIDPHPEDDVSFVGDPANCNATSN